uniref:Dynactin subunit 2 n=1 Tax=Anas platyrhynchos TaxID=8839 RepID=A0A8B9QSW3_ANAPL
MATPKFADLPGIAWNEPEVYETSDTPEGDQAEFELEELTSTSVEHFVINPNAAFEKFKDKRLGTKGVDFSDSTSKTSTTGYKSGEYENVIYLPVCEGTATTKGFWVLVCQHLQGPAGRPSLGADTAACPTPAQSALKESEVEGLKQQLVSSHLQKLLGPAAAIDFTDLEGTLAKRLLQQLEEVKCKKAVSGERPGKAPAPTGDMLTFELYWRPEQDQFSQAIAELEKRLAQLEVMVRYEPDSQNPSLVGLKGTSLVETVQILQAKVNILDMAVLDQVEARLQVRGVLQKVIENTEHKAIMLDPETQSKIHQVHEMLQRWDPVVSSLPDVVQRLLILRDLHEEATWFMQALVYWETTQQEMVVDLRSKVQKTLKENLAIVRDNFSALKAHIKQLQQ